MKKTLLLAMAVLLLAGIASARIPHLINIQGYLTHASSGNFYNGDITLIAEPVPGDSKYQLGTTRIPSAGNYPSGIAVGENGAIWVANSQSGSVSKIDPATNTVIDTITIPSCVGPYDVAIDKQEMVWVSCTIGADGAVKRINPATRAVNATVNLPGNSYLTGIAISYSADGTGTVWTADLFNNKISRIADISGTPYLLTTYEDDGGGWGPYKIAVDSSKNIWVANQSGWVTEIVGPDYATKKTIAMAPCSSNIAPRAISIEADTGQVLVVGAGSLDVCRINPATDTVTKVATPFLPDPDIPFSGISSIAFDAQNNVAWAKEEAPDGNIYQFKPSTGTGWIVGQMAGNLDTVLVYDNINKTIWGTDGPGNSVARFDYIFGERTVTVTNGMFSQLFGPFLPINESANSYKIKVTATISGKPPLIIDNLSIAAPNVP